jgi:outer membrane murein-binding lipoprotein Lpp
MRWKLLWRRLSVTAPRMTIRTHRPWWLQALVWVLILGLSGALALWTYDLGRSITGLNLGQIEPRLSQLNADLAKLTQERNQLSAEASVAQSHLAIERATLEKMMTQVKTLEAENTRLREDLAFFERMVPATSNSGISIRSFSLQRESDTSVRYRLLVGQGGRVAHEFTGNVQLVVSAIRDGRPVTLSLPDDKSAKSAGVPANSAQTDSKALGLAFRTFQRLEGTIPLPTGWVLKSVQAKVLENGVLRAQQSASLTP